MDQLGMILPKGFVVNSDSIYDEIANYPVVPEEKIREYWGVYTTTFRRLIDPTANRLEHFWWHVWGSDRKYLSGKTLARLFEQISTGPTIAPIPGPPNRWEPPVFVDGPPPWEAKRQSNESSAQGSDDEKVEESPAGASASSSVKPAKPHPILKKSKRDSKSGPRPTARFAVSNDQDSKDDIEASSSGTSASSKEVHQPSSAAKPERKKKRTVSSTKRFPAPIASKRRPAMARRISAQGSTAQETAPKEDPSAPRSRSPRAQRSGVQAAERIQTGPVVTGPASTSPHAPALSAKAAGKRPALPPTPETTSRQGHAPGPKGAGPKSHVEVPYTRSFEDVTRHGTTSRMNRPTKLGGAPAFTMPKSPEARPPLPRSQTDVETKPSSHRSPRKMPGIDFSTKPMASTTTVDVQGTIPTVLAEADDTGSSGKQSPSSLLNSKSPPTQPGVVQAIPLERTKSQLTLLLQREKGRFEAERK